MTNSASGRILVVEDEDALASGLRFNFEAEGYHVSVAGDGVSALAYFDDAHHPFDLIVLDLMLPGMSGYQTCQEIRKRDPRVPVLVLSARSLPEDRTLAFDVGGDQYMTKPFNLPELLSRVRRLIRRDTAPEEETIERGLHRFGDVEVDERRFEVRRGEEVHTLTTIEMELLSYFLRHEGQVLSRATIMEDVWKDANGITTRSIDNFVMRLRRIIEPETAKPRHLVSVRGTGYRFVAEPG